MFCARREGARLHYRYIIRGTGVYFTLRCNTRHRFGPLLLVPVFRQSGLLSFSCLPARKAIAQDSAQCTRPQGHSR